jgi:hypothetical protein
MRRTDRLPTLARGQQGQLVSETGKRQVTVQADHHTARLDYYKIIENSILVLQPITSCYLFKGLQKGGSPFLDVFVINLT